MQKHLQKLSKTQQAHFTASMIAFIKLERLKLRNSKNHYAMKSEIWLAATKAAWKQLDRLSTPNINFYKNAAQHQLLTSYRNKLIQVTST